jgi:DNA-binding transcriptional LysR family regulator
VRVFLAVTEHGSTAAAARHLHVSQPAVSVTLSELEAQLGQALFQRLPARGLVPTAFALEKLPAARSLAADLATFTARAAQASEPAGQVTFGCFVTLAPQYVPAVLAHMARRYPRVEVTIIEADLEELERLLESGRIEFALTYDVRAGARTVFEPVAALKPYAVVPAHHPLARHHAVLATELAREPFILIDLPGSRDFLLSILRSEGIEPRIGYRAHSLEMVYGMVANGLGVSVLITRPSSDRAYDGRRVARRPLRRCRVTQGVVLAWPLHAQPTPPARALADCIRERVRQSTCRARVQMA